MNGNGYILVVEDNDLNRKLVCELLRAKGYEVIEATTAEEGLAIAGARPPSLAVLDIRLGGIDGIAASRRLRRDAATAHVPLLALTASVMPGERLETSAAGFDGWLTKPIDVLAFLEEVKRLAGGPS